MYSLSSYGEMLADPVRVRAYAAALETAVEPGSVVVEIGAGPGLFALHAARLGAGKVYAIEPDDVAQLARRLVREHGLADRVEVIQALSTEVELERRADVIVSDLRGIVPFYGGHLDAIADARERLLAPGGILIPRRDVLYATLAEAPEAYRRISSGFDGEPLGFDLSAAAELLRNRDHKIRLRADQCLVPAHRVRELDYRRVTDPDLRADLRFTPERAGEAHGLALWFDAELDDRVGFSNAPGQPDLIYQQAFLPFLRPLEVSPEDRLTIRLRAVLIGGQYVWRWITEHVPAAGEPARFEQSTFHGAPLSPEQLRRRAADHRPDLGDEGRRVRFVLERMDGTTTLEAIAERVRRRFPERFERPRDALAFVCGLSERYGR